MDNPYYFLIAACMSVLKTYIEEGVFIHILAPIRILDHHWNCILLHIAKQKNISNLMPVVAEKDHQFSDIKA